MELGENQNLTPPQEGTTNPNPQPTNLNMEIYEWLRCLRSLVKELGSTKDPSQLSLVISFDIIISFIASAQGQLTNIYDYRAIMFEFYRDWPR